MQGGLIGGDVFLWLGLTYDRNYIYEDSALSIVTKPSD